MLILQKRLENVLAPQNQVLQVMQIVASPVSNLRVTKRVRRNSR